MEVILTPQAEKQLIKIPLKERKKIQKKLLLLENQALAGKKLSGELAGQHSIRAWPYRIIYWQDKKSSRIYVTTIAHRQGVYK